MQSGPDDQRTAILTTNGGVTTYTYNSAGNLATTTDPDGNEKVFSYNEDNQETQELWYNSSGTLVDTLTYTYDGDGNLLTASNSAGTYTFTYVNGQVATVQDPNGVTFTYGYDADGNVTSIADSQGGTVTSTYLDGQLASVAVAGSGVANPLSAQFSYDEDGNLTEIDRYDNGALSGAAASTTTYGYDADGNATSEVSTNSSGATIISYANTFNADNLITQEVYTNPSGTTTTPYGYDDNSEVTSAGSSDYSYDANGNPTGGGGNTIVDNQVTNNGTSTFTYDLNGNMTSQTDIATGWEWVYTYNLNNQLLTATEYNASGVVQETVTNVYDVFGDLLSETVAPVGYASTTTSYSYDVSNATAGIQQQANPVLLVMQNGGTEWLLYDPNGNLLARAGSSSWSAAGTAWLMTDRLGSVRDVLNASGTTVEDSITYDAFGNMTAQTNSAWTGEFGFTGFYYSAALQIYFSQNRPYLPSLGQWMVQDPTGLQAGPNESEYAGNDGVNERDPSGLEIRLYKRTVVGGLAEHVTVMWYDPCTKQLVMFDGGGISGFKVPNRKPQDKEKTHEADDPDAYYKNRYSDRTTKFIGVVKTGLCAKEELEKLQAAFDKLTQLRYDPLSRNSNTYAHQLLTLAGFTDLPDPDVRGWDLDPGLYGYGGVYYDEYGNRRPEAEIKKWEDAHGVTQQFKLNQGLNVLRGPKN